MENKKNNVSPTTLWERKGLRRSQRIIQFATKVTPQFDNTIREQANKEQLLITEMLEKYQAAYCEKISKSNQK